MLRRMESNKNTVKMKEKIPKQCYRRIRTILNIELKQTNRIEAINTSAIPVNAHHY